MITSLEKLQDQELLDTTRALAQEERKLTTQILHYLHEIELRRLHLKRGFASLHEYAVKELGYSDGGAYRRISAMKLLKASFKLKRKTIKAIRFKKSESSFIKSKAARKGRLSRFLQGSPHSPFHKKKSGFFQRIKPRFALPLQKS